MSTEVANWVGRTLGHGRYEVTAKLGEGGMGFVYRARDRNLDTDVVIKVPRLSMMDNPEFRSRFTREIRSLVQLAHPHIVKVTDVGELDALPFAVMQYLPGGSLRDQQQTGPDSRLLPQPVEALAEWLPDVAAALDFMHARGYVHRDVKPENILFDKDGNAYLGDFGIAKVLVEAESQRPQTAATREGMIVGTAPYIAPELVMGEKYDGRVDQYALAVTAFELLSGRYPFEGPTATAILVRKTTDEAPSLAALVPGLPPELAAAVQRGLSRKPEQRFESCAAFARAVLQPLNAGPAGSQARRTAKVRPMLTCPGCRKMFKLPPGAAGKRLRCPACRHTFDVPKAEPASSQPTPPQNTPRTPTRLEEKPTAPPRTPTRLEEAPAALPPRGPATVLEKMPPPPAEDMPRPRSPRVKWIAGGAAAAVTLAAVVLAVVLRPRPEEPEAPKAPDTGSIRLEIANATSETQVRIDGTAVARERWQRPLELTVGQHQLDIGGKDVAAVSLPFAVATGSNPALRVTLAPSATKAAAVAPAAGKGRRPNKSKGNETVAKNTPPPVQEQASIRPAPESVPTKEVKKPPPPPAKPNYELKKFTGHFVPVQCVAFTPDGRQAVSGSAAESAFFDYTLRLWDVASGKELHNFGKYRNAVFSLAMAPDGRRFAAGGNDGHIRLWDVAGGKEVGRLAGHTRRVTSLAFMPDGRRLVSGSEDHTVRLWDVDKGREVGQVNEKTRNVYCVALTPDGRRALVGTFAPDIHIWNLPNGPLDGTLRGHKSLVKSVAVSSDGRRALSGSTDRTVWLWDLQQAKGVRSLTGHTDYVQSVAFAPDGRPRGLSGSKDKTVRLWDLEDSRELRRLEGHTGSVHSVAFAPDGQTALSGAADNTLRLWALPP